MSATKRKNETELEELEDSEEEEVSTKKSSAKKATKEKSEKKAKTEELAWELGEKRKVTVSEFKGNLLVNIRFILFLYSNSFDES